MSVSQACNKLYNDLPKFNFTGGSKSITIGSGNAPVFFNLSVKSDSYYIISACFRVQRGSVKLDACISDGFRNWNECIYDTSGSIYPMVNITLCTQAVTNISLALTAAWSPASGTCTSDCWYTMIEIS